VAQLARQFGSDDGAAGTGGTEDSGTLGAPAETSADAGTTETESEFGGTVVQADKEKPQVDGAFQLDQGSSSTVPSELVAASAVDLPEQNSR